MMLIFWLVSVVMVLGHAEQKDPSPPVDFHPHHRFGFVVRKTRPIPKSNKSIDLSFSNFTLSIENGTFIMDKATQISSSGEVRKTDKIQGDSISKTLTITAVEFNIKSHGDVRRSENGMLTGYSLKANGPMYINDIEVEFTGPLKNKGLWSEKVKMSDCKAKIGVVDIRKSYEFVLKTQPGLQKDIEKAIRSPIEKYICAVVFAVHRYPEIKHRLSQYDSVSLGESLLVKYQPKHVTYHEAEKTYKIFLNDEIVRTDAADPLLSQNPSTAVLRYKSYDRCTSNNKSELAIWVNELFFASVIKQMINNKMEYTEKYFKTKPLKWFKYLVRISEEYSKKFNGSLTYRIGLASRPPQFSCEQDKCKVSMQTSADLMYRPFAQREFDILNFKTNFEAEVEPRAVTVTDMLRPIFPFPVFPASLPFPVYYIKLYGDVKSFKLTENKITTVTDYMQKVGGSFKSGEEESFDKDAFQKEIGETIFKEILRQGVKIVYPLHQEVGLDNLKFETNTHGNGVSFCLTANYSKNPDLWPIAYIRQN